MTKFKNKILDYKEVYHRLPAIIYANQICNPFRNWKQIERNSNLHNGTTNWNKIEPTKHGKMCLTMEVEIIAICPK